VQGNAEPMNTTDLISEWSMDGADRDVAGRFRSTGDFLALFEDERPSAPAADAPLPGNDRPTSSHAPLLVKRADEEDWQPLALPVDEPGERAA
jgi:hypothetical protein